MNQKFTKFGCGFAAATLAFTLVACDDSSSGASGDDLDGLSSETVTSSETTGDSADSNEKSATSQNGNSSTSQEGGSSTSTGTSSSSAELSSNSVETCSHITDNECLITQGCAMTPCMDGTKAFDCATNSDYVCKGGTWQVAESCANISGIDGNDRWNCDENDFTLMTDCSDNTTTYMCVSNHWFVTNDCDPTKPYCGYDDYTLCLKTKLKKYCLKTDWLNESCSYGKDPMRWLYTYNDPEDDYPSNQIRYSCNQSGKWEEFVQQCDPMMDCGNGNNKTDDHGILPDGAPCTNEGEQMTVESYNYQCINNVWTRL
ncbi:hypothetical protein [Fibrobacter sp.]|uniref:hypothetical protein n=1 Tax=Fibrobacter sp. TaxID=35828 RepID=UPI00388EA22A